MNNWLSSAFTTTNGGNAVFCEDVDRGAAFSSFKRHWIQTLEAMDVARKRNAVSSDDVTAICNHFAQMINYLLVDLRQIHKSQKLMKATYKKTNVKSVNDSGNDLHKVQNLDTVDCYDAESTPIFDLFMAEQILQVVFKWSLATGEYSAQMKLEQIKAYELLLSQASPEILVYKPILRPMLGLLQACSGCIPLEVEKRLVVLLNQLCVSLMQNHKLVDYFFHTSEKEGPTKFLIFSLLLPFIHRDGTIGQQARDVLLLCMTLSSSYPDIGVYIAQQSNFCPVLATGLSGLYSTLPRSLQIETEGWHRVSNKDILNIYQLQTFVNSLAFCNAVIQVAHPLVRQQLVEYLYQGFLVPVLGPALCQSSTPNDLIAHIAYMELCLRTVTETDLHRAFLALLLCGQDGIELPIITSIISYLHSPNLNLRLVTLSLFCTLLKLYSEDAMIILIFQYLTPCTHVMVSQRSKLSRPPLHAAQEFLKLIPSCCQVKLIGSNQESINTTVGCEPLSSFCDYLNFAHHQMLRSARACNSWSWLYNGVDLAPSEAVKLVHASRLVQVSPYQKPRVYSDPTHRSLPCEVSSSPQQVKRRSVSLPDYDFLDLQHICNGAKLEGGQQNGKIPAKQDEERLCDSLGESSGYESFNLKTSGDLSPLHGAPRKSQHKSQKEAVLSKEEVSEFIDFLDQLSSTEEVEDLDLEDDFCSLPLGPAPQLTDEDSGELESEISFPWESNSSSSEQDDNVSEESSMHHKVSIGPFLEALVRQIEDMLSASIDASLLAMDCLTTLATYPSPLLVSLLLQPSLVLQPSVRSLYQVLRRLKTTIDSLVTSDDLELLNEAKQFLLSLVNKPDVQRGSRPSLQREDSKRKSISKIAAIFRWGANKENTLQNLPDGSGYRFINKNVAQNCSKLCAVPEEKRHAIICAVLLQEWLMELASCALEHTVYNSGFEMSYETIFDSVVKLCKP